MNDDTDNLLARLRAVDCSWSEVGELCAEAANRITRDAEKIEFLKERGAKAVVAYHVAICSPKGVVPMDEFYDPELAAKIDRDMGIASSALPADPEGSTLAERDATIAGPEAIAGVAHVLSRT